MRVALLILTFITISYAQTVSGIIFPSAANGSYTPDGLRNGKQSWVNTNLYYIYWDSGYWVIDVNTSIGDNAEFYIVSSTEIPPSSGYTNGTGSGNPSVTGFVLPVELTSFSSKTENGVVELAWQTATEVNNYGFEIERTSPLPSPYQGEGGVAGRGWETLGFVEGAGNSNTARSYRFADKPEAAGKYVYRLKQIDLDGSFKYSKEIEVRTGNFPEEFALDQNYPNPFNPSTVISYQLPMNSEVNLTIYNLLGQEVATLVNETKEAGTYKVKFDATNFASGIYIYSLRAGEFTSTKKLTILK